MIHRSELSKVARDRLTDAEALLRAKRYGSAVYLCGYALEAALKQRICRTLRWDGYPSAPQEFQGFQSFRTHDLDILLKLSGREERVMGSHMIEWSRLRSWSPVMRYERAGETPREEALTFLVFARKIMRSL